MVYGCRAYLFNRRVVPLPMEPRCSPERVGNATWLNLLRRLFVDRLTGCMTLAAEVKARAGTPVTHTAKNSVTASLTYN